MQARVILFVTLCGLLGVANASLDDYIELDEEQTVEMNAELGQEVDVYFAHRDLWIDGKDAPFIQFKIYTIEEHGVDSVGSYDNFADLMRGKSDTYKMLVVQHIVGTLHETTSEVNRVRDFEFFEDLSAFMFVVDYIDSDKDVYQQIQIMQWSEDSRKKCVFSSDSSERIVAFYEDSATDALIELMTYCAVGLNVDDETDERS